MTEKTPLDRFIDNGDQDAFQMLIHATGPWCWVFAAVCCVIARRRRRISDDVHVACQRRPQDQESRLHRGVAAPGIPRVAHDAAVQDLHARNQARARRHGVEHRIGTREWSSRFRAVAPQGNGPSPGKIPAAPDARYFEGKSTQESRDTVRCPVGTVERPMSRSLRDRLRDRFPRRDSTFRT